MSFAVPRRYQQVQATTLHRFTKCPVAWHSNEAERKAAQLRSFDLIFSPNPSSAMGNETLQQFAALDLDYLIIGGGTAGLAVAARLTEDPEFRVGVIEAGPSVLNADDNGAINVPGRYGETIGSKYDWKFKTTPQPGLGGRSLPWPRGRILGGTSALNLMAWNRGHRKDYDSWAELGNEGWGWEDLLYELTSLLKFGFYFESHLLICEIPNSLQALFPPQREFPPTKCRSSKILSVFL